MEAKLKTVLNLETISKSALEHLQELRTLREISDMASYLAQYLAELCLVEMSM